MNRLLNLVKTAGVELKLMVFDPINYVLLVTYPTDKYVTMQKFNPETKIMANRLMEMIRQKCPGVEICIIGSTALEIPGRGDIDLMASCKVEQFDAYIPQINKLLGAPRKRVRRFVEWKGLYGGSEVELVLIDPTHKLFKRYSKLHGILSDSSLRERYAKVKLQSEGLSERAYEKKRLIFFNEIGIRG